MTSSSAIFITGPPGAGKSTAIMAVTAGLEHIPSCGMLTRERRRDGERDGFEVVVLPTAETGLLASPDLPGTPRFGSLRPDGTRRLGVDLQFLDERACPAIREALSHSKLVIIDELGPIQALSDRFRHLIDDITRSSAVLLASVAEDRDAWIASVISRSTLGAPLRLSRDHSNHADVVVKARALVEGALA